MTQATNLTNDQITKIKEAIMWVETAWMDEEPMPCEVHAVEILKGLLP